MPQGNVGRLGTAQQADAAPHLPAPGCVAQPGDDAMHFNQLANPAIPYVQPPAKPSGFFSSWLWQGIKIGLPMALGFLIPGAGFLVGTAITGGAMALLTVVEKLAVKGALNGEDVVDVTTDFGTGFLGGALAKIPLFRQAKTYLGAFIKNALSGAFSGGISGATGQAVKDQLNHGEVKSENVVSALTAGAAGGAVFGGLFGLLGHHMNVRAKQKQPVNAEGETTIKKTITTKEPAENQSTKVGSSDKKPEIQETQAAQKTETTPAQATEAQPTKSVNPQRKQKTEDPQAALKPKRIRSKQKPEDLTHAPTDVQDAERRLQEIRSKLDKIDAGEYIRQRVIERELNQLIGTASDKGYYQLATRLEDVLLAMRKEVHVSQIPALDFSKPTSFAKLVQSRKQWSTEHLIEGELAARGIHSEQIPTDPKGIITWARRLKRFDNQYVKEMQALSGGGDVKPLANSNPLFYVLKERFRGQGPRYGSLLERLKPEDLVPASELKKHYAATIRAAYILERREPTLQELLFLHSRPKKIVPPQASPTAQSHPTGGEGKQLSPAKARHQRNRRLLVKMVQEYDGTTPKFTKDVRKAAEKFGPKALRGLKIQRMRFHAKRHTTQGIEGELSTMTPSPFDSRTHYDQTGGLAQYDKGRLITSEYIRDQTLTQWIRRTHSAKYTTWHEGGHGLDKVLYFRQCLRRLNRASTIDDYNKLMADINKQGIRYFCDTPAFKKAYLKDIELLKRRSDWAMVQDRLKYFIRPDGSNGYLHAGYSEVVADGIASMFTRDATVHRGLFPNAMALLEKQVRRFFDFKLG